MKMNLTHLMYNLFLIAAVMVVCSEAVTVTDNNSANYARSGYPVITIVCGTMLLAIVYLKSITLGSIMNDGTWALVNVILYISAVNLACGPDLPTDSTVAGRAATIGMQLMIQVAIGIFAIHSLSLSAAGAYAMLTIFNILCLLGSNSLFNYNSPIWELDTTNCNLYFGSLNIDRCSDNGFLMWLRVLGHFTILIEFVALFCAIQAYSIVAVAKPVSNPPVVVTN